MYADRTSIIFEKRNNDVIYYIRNSIDKPVGFKYNENTYYYVKNLQNDIIGILDSNCNLIVKYRYDSWGNIISITDNNGNNIVNNNHIGIINPFRYRSYYYDNETNLYYLNSRYYSPVLKNIKKKSCVYEVTSFSNKNYCVDKDIKKTLKKLYLAPEIL